MKNLILVVAAFATLLFVVPEADAQIFGRDRNFSINFESRRDSDRGGFRDRFSNRSRSSNFRSSRSFDRGRSFRDRGFDFNFNRGRQFSSGFRDRVIELRSAPIIIEQIPEIIEFVPQVIQRGGSRIIQGGCSTGRCDLF